MHIAVLSGKGGTGKTTLSTNLAKAMNWAYVDCDVEEPNGFIFLKPEMKEKRDVFIPIPKIDEEECISCKKCVQICQFNALAHTNEKILLFEKLCHGCGACVLVCPVNAITEEDRVIGEIGIGKSDDIDCMAGLLNIGEPMAVPIIHDLKNLLNEKPTIIDCSPGSSCTVVASITDVDYAVLVTEPTAFGLHDLKIAVSLVRNMNIPFGVVINRVDEEENMIDLYCKDENIDILGRIPFSRKVATLYSQGKLILEDAEYKKILKEIGEKIKGVPLCN
jgi:MinD superfamily P-loop ATPase